MTTQINLLPIVMVSAQTSQDGDADLSIAIQLNGNAIDLTGIDFEMVLFGEPGGAQAFLDVAGEGYLTNGNTSGVVSIAIPQSVLIDIGAGTYYGDLIAIADGKTIVVGTWTFTHLAMGPAYITNVVTTPRSAATAGAVGYVPDNVGALQALIASLPTSMPSFPGQLWLSGGVLSLS